MERFLLRRVRARSGIKHLRRFCSGWLRVEKDDAVKFDATMYQAGIFVEPADVLAMGW
jgi:hypothetical protein